MAQTETSKHAHRLDVETLGQIVKERRVYLGYTLPGLARKCGLTKRSLEKLEYEGRILTLAQFAIVCDELSLCTDEVLEKILAPAEAVKGDG